MSSLVSLPRHDCLPTVQEDARVDEASHNHGTGRFEKLISGMHLGEVTRRLIHRMWRAAAAVSRASLHAVIVMGRQVCTCRASAPQWLHCVVLHVPRSTPCRSTCRESDLNLTLRPQEMPRWEVPVRLESGRDLLTSAHVGRMAADVTEELAEVAGQVQESFGAEMPKFMR